MGLRFEAWTLPWSTTFERVIADIPVPQGQGQGSLRMSDFGNGKLSVPADYVRLTDLVSPTVGRMIRVYDGSTLIHEWLADRVDFTLSESGLATISGNGLTSAFDRAIHYPYDYPTNPSTFPNHVWGGPNGLNNIGFESQAVTPEIYDVYNDATGGTFTLTVDAQTTTAIAYNASSTTINNAIEALSTVTDVLVAGVGTTADPWRTEFVNPKFPAGLMTGDGALLTGATVGLSIDLLQNGTDEVTQAWTQSQRSDARSDPALHGTYTIFRQSSGAEPVRTGSYSQVVAGTQYAGVQQIIQVEPGGTFQGSVWIRSTAASQTFRLVIRDRYEAWIGQVEITPSANTWTQAVITDLVIPAGVDEIIFRVANVTASPTGTWYFDDAEFNEGLAGSNLGVIVTSLMDDAAVDHSGDTRGVILDWVDYTSFDSTNDSSTTAWPETLSFTAYRGATYGQTFDRCVGLNYEWELVAKASPGATTHDLKWYASGNLGTDHTAANSPAINIGQAVTGGTLVRRIPEFTAVLVEGAEGRYYENKDGTAETNFGRLERYKGDVGLSSTVSLTALAQRLLDDEAAIREAVNLTIIATADHARPLVDYKVGDTLNVQLPPVVSKVDKRVNRITYTNSEPAQYRVELVKPPPAPGGCT